MSRLPALFAALTLLPGLARATGPTVAFTVPPLHQTPAVFGSLPFPCDLYFDQGKPGAGDGTLIDADAPIGLDAQVVTTNTASIQDALDLMDGFGTTSAIWFFLSGPVDAGSLPPSPRTSPALSDAVFCADAANGTPVPIELKFGVDTRIPNVLAVVPLPGRPLAPKTTYTCVVRTAVTGGGEPAVPSADFAAVLAGTSPNTDANDIFGPVLAVLAGRGVAAGEIAGMTVFTTESTTDDLRRIRDVVLPGLPVPHADFTSQPGLVFATPAKLTALLGATPHAHVAAVATGYYDSARFQTHDPNGDGPFGDLPIPPSFVTCAAADPCETTDERFTRDTGGNPVVIDVPEIPFTVVIPAGTPPPGGWPIIIQQHGLGGQRDTVVGFGDPDAAAGFASIGIDAVAHGYRFFDCVPSAPCSQDTANNFGGTAVPDGFADGTLAGFSVSFLTVNLGFFQAFHNFVGVRDNFRQTYADLLSLVRLIKGHSIDAALGAPIDDQHIFYMGHSLGGLMGSGFAPFSPDLKGVLLNASGGGLTQRLFVNSSIGAGALGLVDGILGLDPADAFDQFAFLPNLVQMIVDPADGLNAAGLLLDPGPGGGAPRNVIQVEDFGDQVVPNQANEALAVASGFQLFDPFVEDLHQSPLALAVANSATPGTVHGNAAGGTTTALLLQNGPATHASSLGTLPGTVTFVPEFAHWEDEFPATGQAFPPLLAGINVPNAGILPSVLAWFSDVVAHGPPGTFSFGGTPDFNPIENAEIPVGASAVQFFTRRVNVGGAAPIAESTGEVDVSVAGNGVATRVTAGRSILGTTAQAVASDLPPHEAVDPLGPGGPALPALGFLPFFVTLQRELPGLAGAGVTITYTPVDLAVAGIAAGSADEAKLVVASFDGTAYTPLASTVDTGAHTVTATGASFDRTFVVAHQDALGTGFVPPLIPGGAGPTTDCRGEWEVVNVDNMPFLDRRGHVNPVQACHDGDPACDMDRTRDGRCVLRVALCFHTTTTAACTPAPVVGFTLRAPSLTSHRPLDTANAAAVLEAVAAFGSRAGKQVTFSPAITALTCTAPFGITVATRGTQADPLGTKPGTARLRAKTLAAGVAPGSATVRLRCEP
ncbi:MAG TPA: hypothetical protein VKW76_05725 [Candidatus Binatia bacterium]|nr:hypothetical protein [Candidatus Binatia bacterium]